MRLLGILLRNKMTYEVKKYTSVGELQIYRKLVKNTTAKVEKKYVH